MQDLVSRLLEPMLGGEKPSWLQSAPVVQAVTKLFRAEAEAARARADLLEACLQSASADTFAELMPGRRELSTEQLKQLWSGVNEAGRRLLGMFAARGGTPTVEDLMAAIGVSEPRLLNGPLGGISRRLKKMLKAPDATFYAINPETGNYELDGGTTQVLMDVIEEFRPEWLDSDEFPPAAHGQQDKPKNHQQ